MILDVVPLTGMREKLHAATGELMDLWIQNCGTRTLQGRLVSSSSGLRILRSKEEIPKSERSSIKSVSLLKVTSLPLSLSQCCCLIELAENQREFCHLKVFTFKTTRLSEFLQGRNLTMIWQLWKIVQYSESSLQTFSLNAWGFICELVKGLAAGALGMTMDC